MTRTALVTGGSSGIGAATCIALRDNGFQVIATSRNPEQITDRIDGVKYLQLDLADQASIDACAQAAGTVDLLVNNAGESQSGPLEELPREAIERLFAINVFGAVSLTQKFLPGMRERRDGRIVMVGSMLASFPLAHRGSYVASKAALKGFAMSARKELSPFGVQVTTVEPGSISTGIGERRTKYVGEQSVYRRDFETMIDHLDRNERAGITPDKVAAVIASAVTSESMRPFYAVGSNAPAVFLAQRLLPRSIIERIVHRRHGL